MKKKILELSKSVSKHCVGLEGNVSAKYKDGLIIKASGTSLKTLTNKDLVSFDFKGNQLNNFNKKGSMELSFHTYLLSFDKINYVSFLRSIRCCFVSIVSSYETKCTEKI